jgi:hypothetical protein
MEAPTPNLQYVQHLFLRERINHTWQAVAYILRAPFLNPSYEGFSEFCEDRSMRKRDFGQKTLRGLFEPEVSQRRYRPRP